MFFIYIVFSALYNSRDAILLDNKNYFVLSLFLFLPSQYSFPIAATDVMAAMITFHNDLMFYLIFFIVFILFMLISAIFLYSDAGKDKE
jgi:heme/copper-type cytochrome/quinol oxidase subunit 2